MNTPVLTNEAAVGGTVWVTSPKTGRDHWYRVRIVYPDGRVYGQNKHGEGRTLTRDQYRTPQEQTDRLFAQD